MYRDTSVAAFSNTTYEPLGQKTFWFMVSHRVTPGLFLLLAAFALAFARAQTVIPPGAVAPLRLVSWVLFGGAVCALAFAFVSSRLSYKSAGFMMGDDALRIRRGVLTVQETAIPYRQIQNIDVERTLSQRMMGLSKVVIYTASREEAGTDPKRHDESVLPCVDEDVAQRLQAELLKRANVQKVIS